MKFSCNPLDLSNALNIVSKAISSKPTIPILEGIKIKAEGHKIVFSATDTEIFIEKQINAEIYLEGETIVSGKIFTDFVKKLTDLNSIIIEKLDENLKIYYGENETTIQCINEERYPIMNVVSDECSFIVRETDLKDALDKSLFCVALEDSRPILKGCLLEIEDNTLTIVALDGYKLAVIKNEIQNATGNIRVVIPGKTLTEISKIFEETEENIKVNIQSNNILFDLGHTKITTRLIEGDFLDYRKIIPQNFQTTITVKKEEFENGLVRAALIARDVNKNFSKLSLSNDIIVIKSNSELGNFREIVNCKQEGKDLEIAFNSRYLFDAFSRMKEDYIKINFSGSTSPALITPMDGDKVKYIILPVRMFG